MSITLAKLAGQIGAQLRGDGGTEITGCAALDAAGAGQVSFLANRRYADDLQRTAASAVIVAAADATDAPPHLALLIADDPYFAFRQAMVLLHGWRTHPAPGISDEAFIDPTAEVGELCTIRPFAYVAPRAQVGKRCIIYPNCYVGKDAVIGDDCVLYPNVTIYDHCVLGKRVVLHAGTVIGQDGFGYATHQGAHHKIPQAGNAVIEDDVEMGANCAVDRATLGSTVIKKGTKFSDLVAIGHGSVIGRHNLFVAQVGIAGSTSTGDYVVMGGQVGVAGHLAVGNMVQLAAKSGVMTDVPDNAQYGGQPAIPLNVAKRQALAITRLPELLREFKRLQKRVAELEARTAAVPPTAGPHAAP